MKMKSIYFFILLSVASLGLIASYSCHSQDKNGKAFAATESSGGNAPAGNSAEAAQGRERDLPPNWPWRGINIESKETDASDIDYLASINVNFVRIQIKPPKRAERDNIDPVQAFYKEVQWAESILDACKKHNMTSVLAFNFLVLNPKLKIDDKSPEFWEKKIYRDTVFRMVDIISRKLKDRGDELAAYEVIGEPAVRMGGQARIPAGISDFYQSIINSVRKNDANRWVVLSPGPWGKPTNYKDFDGYNISDAHIIYGAHMYLPDEYTHQGVKDREKVDASYPGKIAKRNWDINIVRKSFDDMRAFEKRKNALMYIGEFQAVRWAKGGDQWVYDVADVLDSFGWSWSYFSYEAGQNFWNPYYVASPSGGEKLDFVGPGTANWKHMITVYGKNKK